MININLKVDDNNIIKELTISGHSGFTNKGNDPLCAGVSTLAYSLLFSLENIPNVDYIFNDNEDSEIERERWGGEKRSGKESGFSITLLSYNNMVASEIRGVTIFFVCGIKILGDNFKKCITFNIEGVK